MSIRLAFIGTVSLAVLGTAQMPAHAQQPQANPLAGAPKAVLGFVKELEGLCRAEGGTPDPDSYPNVVKRHDFDGDGVQDWYITQNGFVCLEVSRGRLSDPEILSAIFIERPGGAAIKAFSQDNYGLHRIERGGVVTPYLWVDAPACGPKVQTGCLRSLRWNAATQKLNFGPLSEMILSEDMQGMYRGFLIGRWSGGDQKCVTGDDLNFHANGRVEIGRTSGTWQLNGDHLEINLERPAKAYVNSTLDPLGENTMGVQFYVSTDTDSAVAPAETYVKCP